MSIAPAWAVLNLFRVMMPLSLLTLTSSGPPEAIRFWRNSVSLAGNFGSSVGAAPARELLVSKLNYPGCNCWPWNVCLTVCNVYL